MSGPGPIATGEMKEFDPAVEKHFPLFSVKAVEPGCTTEFQIEIATTGEVVRITTTESESDDMVALERAVFRALHVAWRHYQGGK